MKQIVFTILLSVGILSPVFSQNTKKSFEAERTTTNFKIDGVLDEADWCTESPIQNFVQSRPNPGEPSSRQTQVWFRYDDEAIYIAAKLYEKQEDIFNLLTNRDEGGNADYFGVTIDPYNAGLSGTGLFVTSAGVQRDVLYSGSSSGRGGGRSRGDSNWNAVWLSNTKIHEDHWTVEMKIPYAVLRFRSSDIQDWAINFERSSRVINETMTWNPIDPSVTGTLNQAGQVKNIKNIQTPTRLFFYPYMSTVVSRSTSAGFVTPQLNGGMDVKYGINDAFTLDMTLIPDFSGVRSDNQVLNLSPFEVRFDENRQFFTEGVQLFNKAGLFYSRRIGRAFGNITGDIGDDENIIARPLAAQLINATKVTGRTNGGLGIGFFNAVTDKTYVTVEDEVTGLSRDVEADPMTNFNVLVLDQNLKNNSSITFTNTSVLRAKAADDANVSGINFRIHDKALKWRFSGFAGYSQVLERNDETEGGGTDVSSGHKYNFEVGKVSGKWRYGVSRQLESDTYQINDLGFLRRANNVENQLNIEYQQFRPQGWFNNYRLRLEVEHRELYKPNQFADLELKLNANGQLKNFWFMWVDIGFNPKAQNDFFEARVDDYVFKRPAKHSYSLNVFSDGRKPFRIESRLRFTSRPEWNQNERNFRIKGRLRVGQRLEIEHEVNMDNRINQRGYATRLYDDVTGDLEQVVFGTRDVKNLTNTLQGNYIFTNRMGLTMRARHYWSRVEYKKFWELTDQNVLIDTNYTGIDGDTGEKSHDRNFNTFNIDMEYNWQFSPGSEIRVVWKRSIATDNKETDLNFFNNFGDTFGADNFDTFTVRLVYFLDYLDVKKFFKK